MSVERALCRHCFLSAGSRPMQRTINGESCAFCCYGCCIAFQVKAGQSEESEAAWLLIRLGLGGFLSMNIMLFSLVVYAGAFTGRDAAVLPWIHLLLWALATPAVIILGGPFMREAWLDAGRRRLTSSALISIGVGAAYVTSTIAVIEGAPHVYFDTACMVLLLFTLGRYLEAAGRAAAVRDLEPLLAAESECATVVDGDSGAESRRPVREVAAGMRVRVRPGERVPVDGVILEGDSHTDEAVITGESRQVRKRVGASVIAGSINLDGPILVQSSGAAGATRWAEICRSVRAALSQRGPAQRVADRLVAVSVPLVLAVGVLTVLYWARWLPFDRALLVGLAVLVVACPCAVGLAAPLAVSIGIGRLARCGCLVREPGALEALARMRLVAFDKTGTLTSGQAHIVGIETGGTGADEALARAAGLERYSEHALGRAIVAAAARRGVEPVAAQHVRSVPGHGIHGLAEGQMVAAGNSGFMRKLGWPSNAVITERAETQEASGYSVVYVGWDGRVRAAISLDDSLRSESCSTIQALRARGMQAALLTGDLAQAARRVAMAVGIEDVRAALSPEAKRAVLKQYRQANHIVAMVGDGLNDGPVLAEADVGIAVGSATDLARETASVVLPKDGLWMLPWVIDVARAVRRTTLTNLMWAFGYNVIALTLAVAAALRPVVAAALMAGSSLLVVMNSLRLTHLPDPARSLPGRSTAEPETARHDLDIEWSTT